MGVKRTSERDEATQVEFIEPNFDEDTNDDERTPLSLQDGLEEDGPTERKQIGALQSQLKSEELVPKPPPLRGQVTRSKPVPKERTAKEPIPVPVPVPVPPPVARTPAPRAPSPAPPLRGSKVARLEREEYPVPEKVATIDHSAFVHASRHTRSIARNSAIGMVAAAVALTAAYAMKDSVKDSVDLRRREEGTRADTLPHPTNYRSYKDAFRAAHPEMLVRSPTNNVVHSEIAPPQPHDTERPVKRAMLFNKRQPIAPLRYGFEAVERPKKRDYETETAPKSPPLLMIFTEPRGVAVDVDGTLMGVTPFIRAVADDKKAFQLRLWGGAYKDQNITVKKDEDGNFKVGVTMELNGLGNVPVQQAQPLKEGWGLSSAHTLSASERMKAGHKDPPKDPPKDSPKGGNQ